MEIIKKIINNVAVTYIKTDKFKSIAGRLCFKSLVKDDSITKRTLLRNIMIDNCKKYNSNKLLNLNCLENYDATYFASINIDGNYITSSFSFSSINEKFLDEKITNNVIDTFNEIIFNPNVCDDAFDKKTFDLCYKRLEESIKRRKENPDRYCYEKLVNQMGKDKPYAFDANLRDLKKLNAENIYKEYLNLMNDSEISLYLIGDFDYEKVANDITRNIKNNKIYNEEILIKNDYKKVVSKKESSLNTSASVLSVGFKCKDLTDFERVYVMPIYSNILGGGATSRLFNEIREKESLAYYCNSSYKKLDGIFGIYAGIKKENKDKTLKLMLDVQKSMSKVTKKELDIVKKDIITSLKQSVDNYGTLLTKCYYKDITGEEIDEEKIKLFNSVTINDIAKVHNKIIIDSIHFVKGVK